MRWPKTVSEARVIQETLASSVKIIPLKRPPLLVAAADAAFDKDMVIGVACLYSYPDVRFIRSQSAVIKASFPYVPGYLTFREGKALLMAIKKLRVVPDVVIFDGQGIAHPRGIGIATHLGLVLGIPSIGCAKSRLIGSYSEPDEKKGAWSPLIYEGRTIGAVLRTRDRVRPLFVSPGHLIDLEGSIKIILHLSRGYRIPEPQRCADMLTRKFKHAKIKL